MQILTKNLKKPESSLSFSYENTVTKGTNLRPIKAVHRDEHFLSLALSDELYHELQRAFYWPKYACIYLSGV